MKRVVTNVTGMGHSELLTRYREFWRVEESFRITKHDLRMRPVFHWKPERVEAHIAIAYMAFACVRHLAYRIAVQQRERMSPERIRKALPARQYSIIRDAGFGRHYALPSTTLTWSAPAEPWNSRCPARRTGSSEAAQNDHEQRKCSARKNAQTRKNRCL